LYQIIIGDEKWIYDNLKLKKSIGQSSTLTQKCNMEV